MNSVIHWPERPALVETVEERDRRDCVALDKKVDGANRELARWLADHQVYSASEVARWLNCAESRVRRLRLWARNGFEGAYSSQAGGDKRADRHDVTLKTKDNFSDDDFEPIEDEDNGAIISDGVEHPEHVAMNALDTIKQEKAVAEAYRKIFKRSRFDSEAKAELYNAITQLIVKWRAVQSTLDKKGQGNGKNQNP